MTIFGEVFFFSKMCPRPFFCCPHSGKVSVAASAIERWVVVFWKVKKQFQAFLRNLSVQFLSFWAEIKDFFVTFFFLWILFLIILFWDQFYERFTSLSGQKILVITSSCEISIYETLTCTYLLIVYYHKEFE